MTGQELALRLRQARNAVGLTQAQAARAIGRPAQTLGGWENARSQPDVGALTALMRLYRVNAAAFLGLEAETFTLAEVRMLQRYRALDAHGRRMADLTLEEETPGLSGGEAQRLKLAGEMGRTQEDSLFVFDEPTIGLHPLDVRVLLGVFQKLIENGATVIVIEHDLDVIRNADFLIDMGPGGGSEGGRIVVAGPPETVARTPESRTGRYL